MHNPAAQSAVSDALVGFATVPLTDQRVAVHRPTAARDTHAQRIATAGDAGDAGREHQPRCCNRKAVCRTTRACARGCSARRSRRVRRASTATPVLAARDRDGRRARRVRRRDRRGGRRRYRSGGAHFRAPSIATSSARAGTWRRPSACSARRWRSRVCTSSIETRTRHALGIAATQAAGLARNAGEALAAIETGKAAADAIEAALIAKHGFTSAPASIDGRRGFAALMAYRFDAASITDGLGTRWVSMNF